MAGVGERDEVLVAEANGQDIAVQWVNFRKRLRRFMKACLRTSSDMARRSIGSVIAGRISTI
jgi:hypothetical protein